MMAKQGGRHCRSTCTYVFEIPCADWDSSVWVFRFHCRAFLFLFLAGGFNPTYLSPWFCLGVVRTGWILPGHERPGPRSPRVVLTRFSPVFFSSMFFGVVLFSPPFSLWVCERRDCPWPARLGIVQLYRTIVQPREVYISPGHVLAPRNFNCRLARTWSNYYSTHCQLARTCSNYYHQQKFFSENSQKCQKK